eukprot:2723751-Prymnesium_polylepis.1
MSTSAPLYPRTKSRPWILVERPLDLDREGALDEQVRRVDEDGVAVRGIAEANALNPGVDNLDVRVRRLDVVLAEHIVKIDHADACNGHHLVAPDLAILELVDAAARRVVNGNPGLSKVFGASRRRPSKILLTAPLQR